MPLLRRLTLPTACAAALLAAPALAQPATAPADITFSLQDPGPMATAPVAIRGITIDGKPLHLDRTVQVQGAWLHTIAVTLANISQKTIVRGGIGLDFPESGDGSFDHPYEAVQSILGREPKIVWLGKDGYHLPPGWESQKPWHLAPGQTVRLTFAAYGDAIQAKLAGKAIHHADFTWETFWFADDSRWSAGVYALPPLPGTRQWRMVTPDEFRRSAHRNP